MWGYNVVVLFGMHRLVLKELKNSHVTQVTWLFVR